MVFCGQGSPRFLNYSSTEQHVGSFQFEVIKNKSAMGNHGQVLCRYVSTPRGQMPKSATVGSYGKFTFSFKNEELFSTAGRPFTFPRVVNERSGFFTFSLALSALTTIQMSHPERCMVTSRGFHFTAFPSWLMMLFMGFFAICISHSSVFNFCFPVNEWKAPDIPVSTIVALF